MYVQSRINTKQCYNPSFHAINTTNTQAALLNKETSSMLEGLSHALSDIISRLERKTPEGIERIMEQYPNIKIGENLVFYNCGEERNTIVLKIAQSAKYKGLTYIAKRKNNGNEQHEKLLNAYMIEGNDKLISNFKPNYSKYFPEKREYVTKQDFLKQDYNKEIQEILKDLDPAVLTFRKFLDKNANIDNKLPDGRLPYLIASDLKEAVKTVQDTKIKISELSKKHILRTNQGFNDYKPTSGQQNYTFRNLGDEKVSITLTEFNNNDGFNIKRLYIDDKEGKPFKTFMIVDNEKFVKNLNQNLPTYIPDKFIYANSEETEKIFLPEFNKYFRLYQEKLNEYNKYINKTVDNYLKKEISGEFPMVYSNLLSETLNLYKDAKLKLKKLPTELAIKIKKDVENLEPACGKVGLWFKDEANQKIIQFFPLNCRQHNNLIRFSVTDINSGKKEDLLIHDFKYVVKNYNPQYPTIIPKILKYATEDEIENIKTMNYFRTMRDKAEELGIKADKMFEKRNEFLLKEKIEAKQFKLKEKEEKKQEELEYKNFINQCKKEFNNAIQNIDERIDIFNETIQNLQTKINNYYNSHKK